MRKYAQIVGFSAAFLAIATYGRVASADPSDKVGPLLRSRAARAAGWSHVIVRAVDDTALAQVRPAIVQVGGHLGRRLPIIHAHTAYLPNAAVDALADNPAVARLSYDRPTAGAMARTGATVGATVVRQELGYDGAGVTVAVIDSGVAPWHDDLSDAAGDQRVDAFVDFVNGSSAAHDGYGHGTHVAGIIAGSGFDSNGARSGIAPAAHLVVLKVLDDTGAGRISDVIAALDYVVANKDALNIRIVNLSVAAGVYESCETDPLTLAAKRAVEAGIVVVAAAGNAGRDPSGNRMYGAITAPGNAPWVLTVGAGSHMGTVDPGDDTIASFSSRGPTAYDFNAKPDLVAPGVGIESLTDPGGTLYANDSAYLLAGTVSTASLPYLSLSGTSMAAPVVAGTVALMLQANPALTPNAVRAILQYTARPHADYDSLTQGAGFLNAQGAVELAHYWATPGEAYPSSSSDWGGHIVWGSHVVTGGQLTPTANGWAPSVTWGSPWTPDGQQVTWGLTCDTSDCGTAGLWQTACADAGCTTILWGNAMAENIVWGSTCGGADCGQIWTIADASAVLLGASDGDTVVWGSTTSDTVVWGSSDGDTVVWGSSCSDAGCAGIIWPR